MPFDWSRLVDFTTGSVIAAAVGLCGTWWQDRRRRRETLADRRAAVLGHTSGLICEIAAACRRGNAPLVTARLLDNGTRIEALVEAVAVTLDTDAAIRVRRLTAALTQPEAYAEGQPRPDAVAARAATLLAELRALAPDAVPILPADRDGGGLA